MRMPPRNAVSARDLLEPMRLSSRKGSGHLKEVGVRGAGFGVQPVGVSLRVPTPGVG